MFKKLTNKVKSTISKYALSAVVLAESIIGDKNGEAKKNMAIDFILSHLPVYLIPFKSLIRILLDEFVQKIIEKAVEKLHLIQSKAPDAIRAL